MGGCLNITAVVTLSRYSLPEHVHWRQSSLFADYPEQTIVGDRPCAICGMINGWHKIPCPREIEIAAQLAVNPKRMQMIGIVDAYSNCVDTAYRYDGREREHWLAVASRVKELTGGK